jgi:hypothetical protein
VNELLEHNRLEEWLYETSQYLEEKLPQLETFELQYVEDAAVALFRLDFYVTPSPLLHRVVLPALRRRLNQASRGSGMYFGTVINGMAACAFVWKVQELDTRKCLRRAMFTELERFLNMEVQASRKHYVAVGATNFGEFRDLGRYLRDYNVECWFGRNFPQASKEK